MIGFKNIKKKTIYQLTNQLIMFKGGSRQIIFKQENLLINNSK